MSGLSSEQRRRLEENKRKALAIRAAKQQMLKPPQPLHKEQFHQQPKENKSSQQQLHQQYTDSHNSTGQEVFALKPLKTVTNPSHCDPTLSKKNPFTKATQHAQANKQNHVTSNRTSSHAITAKPSAPASFYKNQPPTSSSLPCKSQYHGDRNQNSSRTQDKLSNRTMKQGSSMAPVATPFHTVTNGKCVLTSRTRFEVQVDYLNALVELFKSMETKTYNPQTKCWSFDLLEYNKLRKAVDGLSVAVKLEPLPHPVLHTYKERIRGRGEEPASQSTPRADLSNVDECLVDRLLPFQRQGVDFAVRQRGRLLIADDMGLGKTLQAICVACYYRDHWPLLVVVPSSVRFAWREQFLTWVPSIDPQDINVVVTSKNSVTSGQVVVVSYDLLVRSKALQSRLFNIVIMDECHLLKNLKTARTKAALPILKKAARVILLSGTPALSRPSELYSQISAVDRATFPSFHDYGLRYCAGKQHQWGWDFSGSSNMEELKIVLEERIMIRRLKKDVLKQLPAKRREMIVLNPSSVKGTKVMKAKHQQVGSLKGMEQRGALLEYFHETGSCKGQAVKEYVLDLLEADHKFLFFGHHQEMLDCIEDAVRNKYGYVRIDGRTAGEERSRCVKRFQLNDDVRVAILSIMAANAGLHLTAASLVVFGELFWNPGILVQAEDRVHRIGQEDSVNIRYLVATGTADDYIWPLVQEKLSVLGKAGLSKDDFSNADTHHVKDPKQPDMLSFFEQSFIDEVWEDDCKSYPEFVENASPKKKTRHPPKTSPTTPTKLKQRTIFKYLSPSKQEHKQEEVPSTHAATGMPQKGPLFDCVSPAKAEKTDAWEEEALGHSLHTEAHTDSAVVETGQVVTQTNQSAALWDDAMEGLGTEEEWPDFDEWVEDIPESVLQDMDIGQPSTKRSRLGQ